MVDDRGGASAVGPIPIGRGTWVTAFSVSRCQPLAVPSPAAPLSGLWHRRWVGLGWVGLGWWFFCANATAMDAFLRGNDGGRGAIPQDMRNGTACMTEIWPLMNVRVRELKFFGFGNPVFLPDSPSEAVGLFFLAILSNYWQICTKSMFSMSSVDGDSRRMLAVV